jgi:hypothetical protein
MDPIRADELRERLFINKKPTLCQHPVSPSVSQTTKKAHSNLTHNPTSRPLPHTMSAPYNLYLTIFSFRSSLPYPLASLPKIPLQWLYRNDSSQGV